MVAHVATDLLQQAAAIAKAHWGIAGGSASSPTLLGGENLNVAFEASVLKIALESQVDPVLEAAMVEVLADAGLPVPEALPAVDGRTIVDVEFNGVRTTARLLARLAGVQWRQLAEPAAVLEAVGTTLADVHLALAGFDHPGAHRTHAWDLGQAGQHRASVVHIADANLRSAADWALHLHAACDLSECPRGMMHGDLNDENVLFDEGRVSGVLDFGDALEGPLVLDLAITVAYALQHANIGLAQAAKLVGAYDAVRPLNDDEQQVLFPLVLARMATSACIEAQRVADAAATAGSLQPTGKALIEHAHTAPRDAELALCSFCCVHRGPGVDGSALQAARGEALPAVLSLNYNEPLHIVRGRGQFLYAADGRAYLDLVNNVCHVGHCHPHVVRALATQARRLNTNTRYLHTGVVEYAQRLSASMPEALDTCMFVNSGSEASELALRLARAATGAIDVLVIDNAYHGSTGNGIAMSPYKFNGPGGAGCPDWVHVVPAPDVYRGEHNGTDAGVAYALEVGRVIGEATGHGRSIAGFFAESLLSCGGQVPLPAGYLEAAYARVRKAGGVCIADEVQVGFGRVGEAMWGFQLHDVVPDIVVLGKPIGNGHPMGAVIMTRAIAEAFDDGMEFFSTFGGNPVSAAVGSAVLDVIEDEGLQERAKVLGERFLKGLRALQERHACIGDVRGNGLFLGIEFVEDRQTKVPDAATASHVVNAICRSGVLLSTDGPLHNVIKIKPPMVLSEADIDMTLRLLDGVVSAHS